MRSQGKGGLSAATQVKVLSPEKSDIAQGQGFIRPETRIAERVKGECVSDVPVSESAVSEYLSALCTR